ncbi:ankyrin repeat domain-containing protein [Demequina sediminicola]|uniref:ankyrin repeat domain-containing protein n=1 Tax=Demequina sediminicola TaxID=1095026 RepID=UPI0007837D42|nr:ankyrin repeat domain-containing protein [Demequina sediminicola]
MPGRRHVFALAICAAIVLGGCSSTASVPGESDSSPSLTADASPAMGFRQAVEAGNLDEIQRHLDNGADASVDFGLGATPIMLAVARDDVATTELLIDAGADPNATNNAGQNTLHIAAMNGAGTEMAQLLIDEGVDSALFDTSQIQAAPMHMAARNGSLDVLEALIAAGADVDLANERYGATPIFFAGSENQAEAARVLIDAGADLDHQEVDGETPLESAQGYGADDVVAQIDEALAST